MENINEEIMKEIKIGAGHLSITTEELVDKYVDICKENGVDVNSEQYYK